MAVTSIVVLRTFLLLVFTLLITTVAKQQSVEVEVKAYIPLYFEGEILPPALTIAVDGHVDVCFDAQAVPL